MANNTSKSLARPKNWDFFVLVDSTGEIDAHFDPDELSSPAVGTRVQVTGRMKRLPAGGRRLLLSKIELIE